jgi:hypothetical protein
VERAVGLGEGLLDQVLGVLRVAGHPHRRGVELVEERKRVALEASAALGVGLGGRVHLVDPRIGVQAEVRLEVVGEGVGHRLPD